MPATFNKEIMDEMWKELKESHRTFSNVDHQIEFMLHDRHLSAVYQGFSSIVGGVYTMLQLTNGVRLCEPLEGNIQRHPQITIQRIQVEPGKEHTGLGTVYIENLSKVCKEIGLCLHVQSVMTPECHGLCKKMDMMLNPYSGGSCYVKCLKK